jgi:hypothetical protein
MIEYIAAHGGRQGHAGYHDTLPTSMSAATIFSDWIPWWLPAARACRRCLEFRDGDGGQARSAVAGRTTPSVVVSPLTGVDHVIPQTAAIGSFAEIRIARRARRRTRPKAVAECRDLGRSSATVGACGAFAAAAGGSGFGALPQPVNNAHAVKRKAIFT